MSTGIDYGYGLTNIDHENGIRYGVIPSGDVLQAWADDSEYVYPEPESEDEDDNDPDLCAEPIGFRYESGDYKAHQSGDDTDIFITKSPYYTFARFCSPCAPGAGHLRNYDPDGVKTYCFGADWFEDGECPYPVYRVDNDECVYRLEVAEDAV